MFFPPPQTVNRGPENMPRAPANWSEEAQTRTPAVYIGPFYLFIYFYSGGGFLFFFYDFMNWSDKRTE